MPNVGFGAKSTATTSFTGAGIYTPIGIGARRLAANGLGPQIITNVYGYLKGKGGTCVGTLYVGSSSLAGVSLPAAADASVGTGYLKTSDWYIANGTTANYGFNRTSGASFYFARGGSGTTYDTSGGSWTGTAAGAYTYVQAPNAPGNLKITSTIMGQASVSWNHAGTGTPLVTGDNGGTVVTGSRLQYSLVETFGSGVTTVELSGIGTVTASITGLTPGATYFFRVASKNAVTTAASTTSVWSSTKSVFVMVDAATAYETLHPSRNAVATLQNGTFWSLTGHGVGFDHDGNILQASECQYTYNYYDSQTAKYMTQSGIAEYNILRISDIISDIPSNYTGRPLDPFIVYPSFFDSDVMYANNIQYGSFLPRRVNDTYNSVYRMAYKTRLWYPDANDWLSTRNYYKHEVSWKGLPEDNYLHTGQQYYYSIDNATKNLYIAVQYIDASGALNSAESTVSYASLGITGPEEFNVYVEYTFNAALQYVLRVSICPSNNITDFVTATVTYTTKRADIYNSPVDIAGVARSMYITHTTYQDAIPPYNWELENVGYVTDKLTYAQGKISPAPGPAIGVNMNGWEYLQDAASSSNMELSLKGDKINVRYSGVNEIDLSNIVPSFSITPTTTFTGKSIEVGYNNASTISSSELVLPTASSQLSTGELSTQALPAAPFTSISSSNYRPGEMYNAFFDKNQSFSVKVGEVLSKTVKTNNYPLFLAQPTRVVSITDPTTGKVLFSSAKDLYSQYSVSDSVGHLLGAYAFEANGGKVEVAINPDIPNAIDITFTGPEKEIPSYTGPYSLSINDGKTSWASLSIVGYGLKTEPQKINILTGSTESKTPQDIARTVVNPFVDTLERAYDRGAWAAIDAAGPRVSISGSIPTTSLPDNGFGVTPGSVIQYNKNTYRINDITIGAVQTSFNATRYVTVSDFDNAWKYNGSPRTVGFHDGVWDGSDVQDEILLTYYGTDGIGSIIMGIDSTGEIDAVTNPYFFFNINGASSNMKLLFDDDGVPYYDFITAGEQATLLYLDTDFSPYYV
jgi:hypothetical protein